MKKLKIIITTILLFTIILFLDTVYAVGIGLSISSSSVTEGDNFTVTISGINGRVNISCNSNVSISPSGTQWVEGSMTLTGKAKTAGTGTITVTPVNVSTTGVEPQKVTETVSKSIQIKAKASTKAQDNTKKINTTKVTNNTPKTENVQKSNNSNLSALNIEGFTIYPSFNKETTKYSISVNQEINNLQVTASTEDEKAKYDILGNDNFQFGTNNVTIKVTAEDRNYKRVYNRSK